MGMKLYETILADIKEKGYKLTPCRRALIKILEESTRPLSADAIGRLLAREKLKVNKTTVYRELYFLLEQGIITELELGDRKKRYELKEREHHHHVICTNCEKVEDVIPDKSFERQEKKIAQLKNFIIMRHSAEFFGLCGNCR